MIRECKKIFQFYNSRKPTKYKRHSPEFRCTVAKYAIDFGKRPAARKYGVSESTVRGFVDSYKRTRKENPNTDLVVVPKKKRGRQTLLPEELGSKVLTMIKSMRTSGAVINYNIMKAIALGIVKANDRTLLVENGGSLEFGRKWCESIKRRLDFVKRKATTAKPLLALGLIKEVGLTFYNDTNEIVHVHKIPDELIINIVAHVGAHVGEKRHPSCSCPRNVRLPSNHGNVCSHNGRRILTYTAHLPR